VAWDMVNVMGFRQLIVNNGLSVTIIRRLLS
jgi:hypothetical protein